MGKIPGTGRISATGFQITADDCANEADRARMERLSLPNTQLDRCRSVPSACVEQVVEPYLHHLDVTAAGRESVADQEGRPNRYNKSPAAEPEIVPLRLDRPVVCE